MRKSNTTAISIIGALGMLGMLCATLNRAYNPPPAVSPTAKPKPEVYNRMLQAMKEAPWLVQKTLAPDGKVVNSSVWKQGKLISSSFQYAGGLPSIYWNNKLWLIDSKTKTVTSYSVNESSFNRQLFYVPASDLSSAKTENDAFIFYSELESKLQYTIKFDPDTYRPLTYKTTRIAVSPSSPFPTSQSRPLSDEPPSPSPSPTPAPTPVPVPTLLSTTVFEYPPKFSEISPAAQHPDYSWTDYEQTQKEWLERHSSPLLEFSIANNKVKILGVERNSYGDIFLYILGEFPFGIKYQEISGKKIKVKPGITISVNGIKAAYTTGTRRPDQFFSLSFNSNIHIFQFESLSLRRMPGQEDIQVNFTSQDETGKPVDTFQLTKLKWAPDFADLPLIFPPPNYYGGASNTRIPFGSSRTILWKYQAQMGNLPDKSQLDRLGALLDEEEPLLKVPRNQDQARWTLVQLNLKCKRRGVALSMAQKAYAKQLATFKHDPNYQVAVDWSQVLKSFNEL